MPAPWQDIIGLGLIVATRVAYSAQLTWGAGIRNWDLLDGGSS